MTIYLSIYLRTGLRLRRTAREQTESRNDNRYIRLKQRLSNNKNVR